MSKKLDISANVSPTAEVVHVSKTNKEATKEKLQEFIREETRLVKGIFQCFESPGATQPITVRKYPGIPPFRMDMTDGQMYEIPLYVARFLNGTDVTAGALADPNKKNTHIGTCSYGVHGFKHSGGADLPGSQLDSGIPVPIVGITKRIRRFGFQSTEFAGEQ